MAEEVRAFLAQNGLSSYFRTLMLNGFDSMRALQLIETEDMKHMGMKLGHWRLLWAGLAAWSRADASAAASCSSSELKPGHHAERSTKTRESIIDADLQDTKKPRVAGTETNARAAENKAESGRADATAGCKVRVTRKAAPQQGHKRQAAAWPAATGKVGNLGHGSLATPDVVVTADRDSSSSSGGVADVGIAMNDLGREGGARALHQTDRSKVPPGASTGADVRHSSRAGIYWSSPTKSWRVAARRRDGTGRLYAAFPASAHVLATKTFDEAILAAKEAATFHLKNLVRKRVVNEVYPKSGNTRKGVPGASRHESKKFKPARFWIKGGSSTSKRVGAKGGRQGKGKRPGA
mmetsp:Transcript_87339/g.245151  ORF Transcript_87339/g.245151 Transcript_87339/m.245151 type:complete len:351 (+) Transcript_87339:137-1189(+)|eukprot:CAMPEP_0117475140 /NCGR_PEP_ID=MMETSP0784-20121206/9641_1 /TAXON_ID=39447 /ORGANISM="" /LENGTH=350 /DNA_ID=CAMNT_0005269377 /DNA_START=117 /DNA_END=1169 /DNA_ORIENTATION=+